jgi:CubicO group peptidase (beta-lactamase class C family)
LVALAPPVSAQSQSLEGLDAYIEAAMEDWQVPGAAVGVVSEDTLIYARGFGVREIGKPEKVDERTLFAVASNTKAFTAALLGMLVEEGKLGWDDRVTDHLRDFQLHDPYVTREIRIRDLLTHRSGLPTFGGDNLWIGGSLDREEILRRIRYLKPTASFRTRYQYQNIMYVAAGQIVPAVTGESWDAAILRRIFEPLGMADSNTTIRALETIENVAAPHEVVDGGLKVVEYDFMDSTAPAGAIVSNVVDMSRWMRLNLDEGLFEGKRILSSGIVREMQSMQIPTPISEDRMEMLGTRFSGYGLGWGISDYRNLKLVTHGGGLSGMISYQALVPEKKLGVIVLTNFAPNELARALVYRIIDTMLGEPVRDWSAEYLKKQARDKARADAKEKELLARRVSGTRPSLDLEDYTGSYRDDLYGEAEVLLEEGRLLFSYNPRHTGALEHWHHDTFRVAWRHAIYDMAPRPFLTFDLDETGRAAGLEVTFYQPVRFERVRE